ncbi:MAG: Jag N-terminal domain-containing protein [Chloroflexi bacterium]|nr:Jag N-terminal domain-containing protein [Chloroflexota bacterium]
MSETRTVEATGADIEQAIESGLVQLDVSRENVIVEVLEEPSRGLLGIGAKQARVRLTTAVAPRSAQPTYAASTPRPVAPPPPTSEPRPVERPSYSSPRSQPQPERRDRSEQQDDSYQRVTQLIEDETELPNDVQLGLATLREILGHMQIDAGVTVERSLEETDAEAETAPWILHVHGEDLGLLIGHRGETLSSLQYLTRLIASRDLQQRADFIIDVENYKGRREMLLRKLAHRMAKDAVRRRRTVELEPMPPHERRIIHLALKNRDDVYTESVGEGNRRKVTIVPK